MRIDKKYTQFNITPDIEDYLERRIGTLEKLISRYEEKDEVVVYAELARSTKHHRQGEVFYAEAMVELPNKLIRANCEDEDIRRAIDVVREKLETQINKYKNKKVAVLKKRQQEFK